jgi:hypothetical protein
MPALPSRASADGLVCCVTGWLQHYALLDASCCIPSDHPATVNSVPGASHMLHAFGFFG